MRNQARETEHVTSCLIACRSSHSPCMEYACDWTGMRVSANRGQLARFRAPTRTVPLSMLPRAWALTHAWMRTYAQLTNGADICSQTMRASANRSVPQTAGPSVHGSGYTCGEPSKQNAIWDNGIYCLAHLTAGKGHDARQSTLTRRRRAMDSACRRAVPPYFVRRRWTGRPRTRKDDSQPLHRGGDLTIARQ